MSLSPPQVVTSFALPAAKAGTSGQGTCPGVTAALPLEHPKDSVRWREGYGKVPLTPGLRSGPLLLAPTCSAQEGTTWTRGGQGNSVGIPQYRPQLPHRRPQTPCAHSLPDAGLCRGAGGWDPHTGLGADISTPGGEGRG